MALEKMCFSIQRIRWKKSTGCNAFKAVERGFLSCKPGKIQ